MAQQAELDYILGSEAAQASLAENYGGLTALVALQDDQGRAVPDVVVRPA